MSDAATATMTRAAEISSSLNNLGLLAKPMALEYALQHQSESDLRHTLQASTEEFVAACRMVSERATEPDQRIRFARAAAESTRVLERLGNSSLNASEVHQAARASIEASGILPPGRWTQTEALAAEAFAAKHPQ